MDILLTIRALEKFDISDNALYGEGTKILAEALSGNQVMVELNLARNRMGTDGAMDIAKTIPTMGALTSLNVSNNYIGYGGDTSGVKALAAAIPECR